IAEPPAVLPLRQTLRCEPAGYREKPWLDDPSSLPKSGEPDTERVETTAPRHHQQRRLRTVDGGTRRPEERRQLGRNAADAHDRHERPLPGGVPRIGTCRESRIASPLPVEGFSAGAVLAWRDRVG